MSWKTLDEMDLSGTTVLTRVEINVPMDAGRVPATTRIDRIVPTVEAILSAGGKPMLIAHYGRPKGKVVDAMSLRHVVPALEAALGHSVQFIETLEGAEALTQDARAAWRASAMSFATMPFLRPTARMRPPPASRS